MSIETVCAVITCTFAVGGVLIYIGNSLRTLQHIDSNQKILFDRTDKNSNEIVRIDKELAQVKTRQEDCDNCP